MMVNPAFVTDNHINIDSIDSIDTIDSNVDYNNNNYNHHQQNKSVYKIKVHHDKLSSKKMDNHSSSVDINNNNCNNDNDICEKPRPSSSTSSSASSSSSSFLTSIATESLPSPSSSPISSPPPLSPSPPPSPPSPTPSVFDDFTTKPLVIRLRDVRFRYRRSEPLIDSLNIHVPGGGHIYGLLGPSCCGKSTTLQLILGLLRPSNGDIQVYGERPNTSRCPIPGPGVGYMPQDLALMPTMTIGDHFTYYGRLHFMSTREINRRSMELMELFQIPATMNRTIQTLSGGQQRRTSLAVTLLHSPPVLILDEPTVGIDPLLRNKVWQYLQELATVEQRTIILTTHYIEEARNAHTIGLMRYGRLLAEASPDRLLKQFRMSTIEQVFLNLCELEDDEDGGDEGENGEGENSGEKVDKKANMSMAVVVDNDHQQQNGYTSKDTSSNDHHHNLSCKTKSNQDKNKTTLSTSRNGGKNSKNTSAIYTRYNHNRSKHYYFNLFRVWTILLDAFAYINTNPRTLACACLLPTLQIFLFHFSIGKPVSRLPISVYTDEPAALITTTTTTDGSPTSSPSISELILQHLSSNSIVVQRASTLNATYDLVHSGESYVVMNIPHNFTQCLVNRMRKGVETRNWNLACGQLALSPDNTYPFMFFQMSIALKDAFFYSIYKYFGGGGGGSGGSGQQQKYNPETLNVPFSLKEFVYGKENFSYVEFMTPGMHMALVYMSPLMTSLFVLLTQKVTGQVQRSRTCGVKTVELLVAHFGVNFFILLIQTGCMMFTSLYYFDAENHGSLVLVLAQVLVVGIAGISLALFMAVTMVNRVLAMIFIYGLIISLWIISGIFWPVQNITLEFVRTLVQYLPLTYPTESARSILNRGWGLEHWLVQYGFGVSLIYTIVPLIGAVMLFK